MQDNKVITFNPPLLLIIIILFLTLGIGHASAGIYTTNRPVNFLDTVDFYLGRAHTYTAKALLEVNAELDSIEGKPIDKQLEALAKIGHRLEPIDIDSAMFIYTRGEELAAQYDCPRFIKKFRYRKGSVMPMMGLVREGIDVYNSIAPEEVDPLDRFDYFTTGHHIFDAAVDYYRVDSLKQKYRYMSDVYNDSALNYVEPGSVEELYYRALPKLKGHDRESGISDLTEVLTRVPENDPLFAKAAAEIALAYMSVNDRENAKYFLALSAIGDLKAGTRETTSLHRLGKLLNNDEEYNRAYDYLTYALESAVASGSSLRTIEIGEIMPEVVTTVREIEKQQTSTLVTIVIFLSFAVVIFVAMVIYTTITRRRLSKARSQLVDISDSKDLYIRKLITLCGAYLTALENFSKLAARKIKVGQVNDLLAMVESGKVMREQLQEFFEVFDDTFLVVYPDFVDRVNDLLMPDKKLSLTEDGRLGPELRIVAFMRLGMDDSTQIARFLGLSLNTVYTYRNKVKTKAVNRAEFENDVRNIGRPQDE